MACRRVPIPGGFAIVCGPKPRPKPCVVCRGPSERLCDGPRSNGRTCDAALCRACAVSEGEEDYCTDCAEKRVPKERRVLIVSGARVLADVPEHVEWVRAQIRARAEHVGVIVTGDARGPDVEARAVAREIGVACFVYTLRGTIERDGEAVGCWTTCKPPPDIRPELRTRGDRALWKAWCLHRDRQMVKQGARRLAQGYRVRMLALFAPAGLSKTEGTAYTASCAEEFKIPVERLTARALAPPGLPGIG